MCKEVDFLTWTLTATLPMRYVLLGYLMIPAMCPGTCDVCLEVEEGEAGGRGLNICICVP